MSFKHWFYYIPLALLINGLALYGMDYVGLLGTHSQKKKDFDLSVRLWSEASAWQEQSSESFQKSKEELSSIQNPLSIPNASQRVQRTKRKTSKVLTLPIGIEEEEVVRKARRLPSRSPGRKFGKDNSNVKHEAEYLRQTAPVYPRRAWELGQQGTVLLRVLVNEAGLVNEIKVHRSSNFKLLDQAALVAVKNWEFKIKNKDGARQDSSLLANSNSRWIKVPVRFLLEEKN